MDFRTTIWNILSEIQVDQCLHFTLPQLFCMEPNTSFGKYPAVCNGAELSLCAVRTCCFSKHESAMIPDAELTFCAESTGV